MSCSQAKARKRVEGSLGLRHPQPQPPRRISWQRRVLGVYPPSIPSASTQGARCDTDEVLIPIEQCPQHALAAAGCPEATQAALRGSGLRSPDDGRQSGSQGPQERSIADWELRAGSGWWVPDSAALPGAGTRQVLPVVGPGRGLDSSGPACYG